MMHQDEPSQEYIERGLRQAEYANVLANTDWVVVNRFIQNGLNRLLDELHDEFGLREPTDSTILRNYIKVRGNRMFKRGGRL